MTGAGFSRHIGVAQSTLARRKPVRNDWSAAAASPRASCGRSALRAIYRGGNPCSPVLWPHLPVPAHPILERAELLDPHWPARVHAPGGDADLGAETEFAPIRELGRGVVQDDRRIDLLQEPLRRGLVLGHDAVGVMRAIGLDVVDRRIETVDDADSDDRVEIFGAPVLFGRRRRARVGFTRRRVAADRAAGLDQRVDQLAPAGRGRPRDAPKVFQPRHRPRCAASWR